LGGLIYFATHRKKNRRSIEILFGLLQNLQTRKIFENRIIPVLYSQTGDRFMSSPEIPSISLQLLAAKKKQGLTFTDLEKILGRDEVWIAAVFYRQASASPEEAEQILQALNLSLDLLPELTAYPCKGLGDTVPTDPLIYRFYEIMQVYGMPIKEIVHEKFGDGIMSAIDFTLDIEKVEDPKGDRVKVIMNGKFLPYKKW
jgi:cyanate lyase